MWGLSCGSKSAFGWVRVILSGFESWWYIFVECQLAEGFGRKGFKGVFRSVNGCWASDEKVLCGVLWRGDGRGGVFLPFFPFLCRLTSTDEREAQISHRFAPNLDFHVLIVHVVSSSHIFFFLYLHIYILGG